MSQYLQDEFLRNLTIDENAIKKINHLLTEIASAHNADHKDAPTKNLKPTYVIRFDGKGFRLFDFAAVIKHFEDARKIERLVFLLNSDESAPKAKGKSIELSLDPANAANSFVIVQDDDADWVELVFGRLKSRLSTYKNINWIVQNEFTQTLVKLFGLSGAIFISLWLATKVSPRLKVDGSFVFIFIISLMFIGNFWDFLEKQILKILNFYWPIIAFKEKKGLHWLFRGLITTTFVGFTIYVIHRLVGMAFGWLGPLISR